MPVLLCQSNGTWSSAVPTCTRMRCYTFPKLANGYIKDADSEYYYGDTARAECFKGYNMIGNNVLTCSEDQSFSGVPTCEDKDECAQGQVFINGSANLQWCIIMYSIFIFFAV